MNLRSLDSWIQNGQRNKCPRCGKFYYDSDGGCCNPRGEINEEVEGFDVTWYYDGDQAEITSIGTPSGCCYMDKELPRFYRHLQFWMPEIYKILIDYKPDLEKLEEEEIGYDD